MLVAVFESQLNNIVQSSVRSRVALGIHNNSHSYTLMLLRNLLPGLAVHIAIDEGLGDVLHLQLGKLPFYH